MADYRTDAPPIVKEFLRFLKTGKNLSDKTINEYFLDLRTFLRFMKLERAIVDPDTRFDEIDVTDIDLNFVRGIRKVDINSYIHYLRSDRIINEGSKKEKQGLSAVSSQRKIACIKSFFAYCTETADLIDKDPSTSVIFPKEPPKLPAYLSEEECYKLLNSIEGTYADRDYCIILFFLTSGLRVSELVSIDIQDLQTEKDNYFLKVKGKGGKERQVYLSEACINAALKYLETRSNSKQGSPKSDALFLSRRNDRMSVDAVQKLVKKAMRAAGLREYSPHKLRHTAATLMLQNGVDVRTVQEVLGHDNLSTTQIYTHVNSPMLREASRANPISRIGKTSRKKSSP